MKRLLFAICLLIFSCKEDVVNTNISGQVFGTSYSVIYNSEVNYEKQFDSLFYAINKSMSTYIPNSDISKINSNKEVEVDIHFKNVFND